LGRIGDKRAIEPLIALLGDEKDHVRYMAAKGLAFMPDDRSVGPLIRALEDPNVYVQSRSAMALGEIGGRTACEALQRAVEGMDSGETREIFVQAALRACR
jgi:HEAT repeat protein